MKVFEKEKNIKTEIICVIDKSGSMNSIKSDAIGGFNQFLKEQKEITDDTNITLNLFDSNFKPVYSSMPINESYELNDDNYKPSSMTALYDAIGLSIDESKERFESDSNKPDRVLMVILTDGEENRSTEYTKERVFEMIDDCSKNDWEFIFLAANQDAMKTASSLNIKKGNSMNFSASSDGMKTMYSQVSSSVKSYRSSKSSKFDDLMGDGNSKN